MTASYAEHQLLFSPSGGYGAPFHANFLQVAPDRLWSGHFLGLFSVPFYLLGYAGLWAGLGARSGRARHWMLALGAGAVCLGEAWLSFRAAIGFAVHAGDAVLVAQLSALTEPLLQVTRLLILGASGVLAWGASRPATGRATVWALANPASFLALVIASHWIVPGLGAHLVPATMNVAHASLFAAWAWVLRP